MAFLDTKTQYFLSSLLWLKIIITDNPKFIYNLYAVFLICVFSSRGLAKLFEASENSTITLSIISTPIPSLKSFQMGLLEA
jgi:hypothetical protein